MFFCLVVTLNCGFDCIAIILDRGLVFLGMSQLPRWPLDGLSCLKELWCGGWFFFFFFYIYERTPYATSSKGLGCGIRGLLTDQCESLRLCKCNSEYNRTTFPRLCSLLPCVYVCVRESVWLAGAQILVCVFPEAAVIVVPVINMPDRQASW